MAERRPRRGAMLAVVTTLADRRQACTLARALVERGLVACVHWWPIESCYRWQGRMQQDHEYRLVCKTTRRGYTALAAAISALHPYELPALYAVSVARTSQSYARWVEQSCQEPRATQARRVQSLRTLSARTPARGRLRRVS